MRKNKLWTKDFSLITISTIFSAIGGEAMNLPISLLVFDETKSTLLAAIILVCGMLPDVILPIFIAPFIDKGGKKKWIVGLDAVMAVLYLLVGIIVLRIGFNYLLYIVFTLVIGTISVFYRLAFQAWYPDLIPTGEEQKGFAVSGTIYPTVTIVMAPVAAFLYQVLDIGYIFFIVAGITVIDVILECFIKEIYKPSEEAYGILQYFKDIKEGFIFIKKEKGIRNIYSYMSITSGASSGVATMTQAYYQTQPWLSVAMLGFLRSSETIGRVVGGLIQYKKEVPVQKRFMLTKFVYAFYDTMDAFLLFMPYPFMLMNRFLCGAFGITSATIRETAVQSYLPPVMRARVHALFNTIFAVGGIVFQLIAGALGQIMSFRTVALIIGLFTLCCMILLICIPKKENQPIYESVREYSLIEPAQ
ncbi:MAG: Major Facilitator Superfamily [Clostridiales bacterium]|jgi:MFS family permease|nr:Major Facilitator Superfamily [Clostridiales bacterium]